MPLQAGWTTTISQFEHTSDGAGGIGATIGFELTSPSGQTVFLGPVYLSPLTVFGLTKRAIAQEAWKQVVEYARSTIAAAGQPLATPARDPLIGSTFSPP